MQAWSPWQDWAAIVNEELRHLEEPVDGGLSVPLLQMVELWLHLAAPWQDYVAMDEDVELRHLGEPMGGEWHDDAFHIL